MRGWKRKEALHRADLEGDALLEANRYVARYSPHIPYEKAAFAALPERMVIYSANFSHGYLLVITLEPIAVEEEQTLVRFAKVFEMTYRRFLDLKQAEAQTREAQIEAALERVRTRAMAMRRSDELAEAAELLYKELKTLGIIPLSCGYVFLDEETEQGSVWMTTWEGSLFMGKWFLLPSTEDPVLRDRYASWKRKEPLHRVELEGGANREHHRYLARYSPLTEEEILALIPERLVGYTAHFSHGYLIVVLAEVLPGEDEQTLVRFANVFEQTYTRFLDLKKSRRTGPRSPDRSGPRTRPRAGDGHAQKRRAGRDGPAYVSTGGGVGHQVMGRGTAHLACECTVL